MLRLLICLILALGVGCNLFGETQQPGTTTELPDVGPDLDAQDLDVDGPGHDAADKTPDVSPDPADDVGEDAESPPDACVPEDDATLCAELNHVCGDLAVTDRCSVQRTVSCGECEEAGTTCYVGQCVCEPESDDAFCARLGKNCDDVTELDSCGFERTVNCGSCTEPDRCGGGGANVCGCPLESDAVFCDRIGAQCGSFTALDSCNVSRTSFCGQCDPGAMCDGTTNLCVCQPETDVEFCARIQGCGVVTRPDNCGQFRTRNCNHPCPTGEQCINEVCSCQPQSTASFCANHNATCGELSSHDNCGLARTENCGTCAGTDVCFKYDCHAFPLNDLVLNLKASSGVQVSQQRVQEWFDPVGGTTWVPRELADRPTRVFAHNNHRAIRFDGRHLLTTNDLLSLDEYTITLVIERADTDLDGVFLGSSDTLQGHHEFMMTRDPAVLRLSSSSGYDRTIPVLRMDQLHVLTLRFNGSEVIVSQGHQQVGSIAAQWNGEPIEINQIGAIHRKYFLRGDIYEIYIWNRVLEEEEVLIVAEELHDRYDIQP